MADRTATLRSYLEALCVAVLLATFARTFVVQAFRIPTASMQPNLVVGDHLLVNKFVYGPTASRWERRLLPVRDPEPGDVVVFRYPVDPERDFVKRCVAGPGARVRLRAKALYVDGEPVDETAYVVHGDPTTYPDSPFIDDYYRNRDNFGPLIVPRDHLFVLGDNRDRSNDSRFWGAVPRHLVEGRALAIYFSTAPLEADSSTADGSWWPMARVRWSRIGRPVR